MPSSPSEAPAAAANSDFCLPMRLAGHTAVERLRFETFLVFTDPLGLFRVDLDAEVRTDVNE